MNQYGALAERHWRQWLPNRCRTIADPHSFFSTLGEEVAQEIEDLSLQLAGDDPPGEDYLAKLGRLNMARLRAEETVLRERVLLPPETEAQDQEAEDQKPSAEQWIPLVEDPQHPYWQAASKETPEER
jgi:hypothetical protein